MSNYNQAKFLTKAINSVLSQKTNFDFQLIITDDHSTKDNSVEVIKNYEKKYDNIKAIFSNKNGGYLENILRAKRITKTDYFCLLDADDYWTDCLFLQKAYSFLENNNDFVIYQSNVSLFSSKENKEIGTFISNKEPSCSFDKFDFFQNKNLLITQTTGMFFRNVIYKKGIPKIVQDSVSTISERSFEGDWDRFYMHLKYGKAYYKNEIVGIYRITSQGIWSSTKISKKIAVTARAYIDYYRFYNERPDFFITNAWNYLREYFEIKLKEIEFSSSYSLLEDDEIKLINSVIQYCSLHSKSIIKKKSLRKKISLIKKSIISILSNNDH